MINNFSYSIPVKIEFGTGLRNNLERIVTRAGFSRGILICDKMFVNNGIAQEIVNNTPSLVAIFSEITPNPLLSEVEKAAALLNENNVDYALALGGGSSMDLAKFACSFALASKPVEDYFYKREVFENKSIPVIVMPTTAGTGSEVTPVSVCNDAKTGIKAPLISNNFYPHTAIIDPFLTLSVPPFVTATTGIDAMSHALEAVWSKNHQPICDALATEGLRYIFRYIEQAYDNGNDLNAREGMSYGALLAGLAFGLPKTAGVHACSYPLSYLCGLSHGEACAFTLDLFVKLNATYDIRVDDLAKQLGFESAIAMAERIIELKKKFKFRTSIKDLGCLPAINLAEECVKHPLFLNNPIMLTKEELAQKFGELK